MPMNALFQYLKRLGLVKKVAHDLNAPYALTIEGSDTLAELIRRDDESSSKRVSGSAWRRRLTRFANVSFGSNSEV